MTDKRRTGAKPAELGEEDLESAQGGITLDNGLKQSGVIVRKKPEGDGVFLNDWINGTKDDPEAGR